MLALASSGPWMPPVLLRLPHPSFKASLSHDRPLLSRDVRHVHAQRWTQGCSLQKSVNADPRTSRYSSISSRLYLHVLSSVSSLA